MKSGVFVVVFNEHKTQVLLHKQADIRIWSLPGGGIESDETWEEAGVREVYEETGYQIKIERLIGEYSIPQIDGFEYACLGCVVGGEAIKKGPETLAVMWFATDALPRSVGSSTEST